MNFEQAKKLAKALVDGFVKKFGPKSPTPVAGAIGTTAITKQAAAKTVNKIAPVLKALAINEIADQAIGAIPVVREAMGALAAFGDSAYNVTIGKIPGVGSLLVKFRNTVNATLNPQLTAAKQKWIDAGYFQAAKENDKKWYGGDSQHITGTKSTLDRNDINDSIGFVLGTIECDLTSAISLELIKTNFQELVDAFNASVGLLTEITYLQVENKMKRDTEYLQIVEDYVREYNARNYHFTDSITFKDVASYGLRVGRDAMTASELGLNRKVMERTFHTISADDWQDILANVATCYTNDRIEGLRKYLYSQFFITNIDGAANGVVWVRPTTVCSFSSDHKTLLQTAWNNKQEADAANPWLKKFMSYLKWYNADASYFGKARHVEGVDFRPVHDPDFIICLQNFDIRTPIIGYDAGGRRNIARDTLVMYTPNDFGKKDGFKLDPSTEVFWTTEIGELGEYIKLYLLGARWWAISAIGWVSNQYVTTNNSDHIFTNIGFADVVTPAITFTGVPANAADLNTDTTYVFQQMKKASYGVSFYDILGILNDSDYYYRYDFKFSASGLTSITERENSYTSNDLAINEGYDAITIPNVTAIAKSIRTSLTVDNDWYQAVLAELRARKQMLNN